MGYWSDVTIAIYGPEPAMLALIAADRMKENSILRQHSDCIENLRYLGSDGPEKQPFRRLLARFHRVKWYSDFPDVVQWYDLMQLVVDQYLDRGLCYEFIRVGEDVDDIEGDRRGEDVEFFLDTVTTITVDTPKHLPEEGDEE